MIPGFNYLIYMGQILEYLKQDPELVIVLDSPSSGHALTMFEATKNFNQIFQKGALYDDTLEMIQLLKQKNFLQVQLITLPSPLPLQESQDFIEQLQEIEPLLPVQIICNNSLIKYSDLKLPEELRQKLTNENRALEEVALDAKQIIPFCMANDSKSLVKELLPSMENLV